MLVICFTYKGCWFFFSPRPRNFGAHGKEQGNCHQQQITIIVRHGVPNTLRRWSLEPGRPGGALVKNSPANAGDVGSIPGLERSPGEENGNLLQESLCDTQVCCTQTPWPCGRPLLTCTAAGDSQALKGRSGSVSVGSPGRHKVLFEPSKHLWQVWGLILKAILILKVIL